MNAFFRCIPICLAFSLLVSGAYMFLPSLIMFPVLFFAFSIALSLSRGFSAALPLAIGLGLLGDIATLGRVGFLSAFMVGLVYTASFFSRRFVGEHSLMTALFSGLLTGIVGFLYPFFSGILLHFKFSPSGYASVSSFLLVVAGGVIVFPIVAYLLRLFDRQAAPLSPQLRLMK